MLRPVGKGRSDGLKERDNENNHHYTDLGSPGEVKLHNDGRPVMHKFMLSSMHSYYRTLAPTSSSTIQECFHFAAFSVQDMCSSTITLHAISPQL